MTVFLIWVMALLLFTVVEIYILWVMVYGWTYGIAAVQPFLFLANQLINLTWDGRAPSRKSDTW